jgi:hypothetical protein
MGYTITRGNYQSFSEYIILCYKPEVAESRTDEVDFFFLNIPNPSGRTMTLGLTQPLKGMSTRNLKKKETNKQRNK